MWEKNLFEGSHKITSSSPSSLSPFVTSKKTTVWAFSHGIKHQSEPSSSFLKSAKSLNLLLPSNLSPSVLLPLPATSLKKNEESSSPVPPRRNKTSSLPFSCPKLDTTNYDSSYRKYFHKARNWRTVSRLKNFHVSIHASPKPGNILARKAQDAMDSEVESAKRAAAFQAVREHLDPESHTLVGIGSGSTVVHVVDAIGDLFPSSATDGMTFFPTGEQSKHLITAAGLRLGSMSSRLLDRRAGDGSSSSSSPPQALDVTFDGADEVDPELNLIKGGGACLWQEKFVACAAKKFICVADYRKVSFRLGTKWKKGIPIEVHPLAAADVLRELVQIGSKNPQIRQGGKSKAGPVVTDNGMWLIDAPFEPLLRASELSEEVKGMGEDGKWEVENLAARIKSMLGVVEVGLFCGRNGFQAREAGLPRAGQKPVAAYCGMEDGSVRFLKA